MMEITYKKVLPYLEQEIVGIFGQNNKIITKAERVGRVL